MAVNITPSTAANLREQAEFLRQYRANDWHNKLLDAATILGESHLGAHLRALAEGLAASRTNNWRETLLQVAEHLDDQAN